MKFDNQQMLSEIVTTLYILVNIEEWIQVKS